MRQISKKDMDDLVKYMYELKSYAYNFVLFYKLYLELSKTQEVSRKHFSTDIVIKSFKPFYIFCISILNGLNDHFDIDESVEVYEPDAKRQDITNTSLTVNDTKLESQKCNKLLSAFTKSNSFRNLKSAQKTLLKENTLLYDRINKTIFSIINLMSDCMKNMDKIIERNPFYTSAFFF